MKKLLFSALACVAFAGSGFAANEIVVKTPKKNTTITEDLPKKPCEYSIIVTDKDGNILDSFIGRSDARGGDCIEEASGEAKKLSGLYPSAATEMHVYSS